MTNKTTNKFSPAVKQRYGWGWIRRTIRLGRRPWADQNQCSTKQQKAETLRTNNLRTQPSESCVPEVRLTVSAITTAALLGPSAQDVELKICVCNLP